VLLKIQARKFAASIETYAKESVGAGGSVRAFRAPLLTPRENFSLQIHF